MKVLDKLVRSRTFNLTIGIMGLIAIPLLVFNLYIAEPVDRIFAFVELTMILLLFGTFVQLVEGKRRRK